MKTKALKTLLTAALTAAACLLSPFSPAAAALQGLQAGMEAPDFRLPSLDGPERSFEEVRGEKLTALVFWSTWSKNSPKALTRLAELHEKYQELGLAVVGINADGLADAQQAVGEALEGWGIAVPTLLDPGLESFHDYGVIALPTTVILDGQRTIAYEMSGFPLIGAERMADFVSAAMEGKAPAGETAAKGFAPDKKALRCYNMGTKALKSGRMAETAPMWFEKAVEADPRFALPHISLGRFYAERGERQEARAQFESALEKSPQDVAALCELGMLLVEGGDEAGGEALLKKALEIEPSYTPCYYYLGYLYGCRGRQEEAAVMFARAADNNRLDYRTYVFMARSFVYRGLLEEAAESYRQALKTILSQQ